MIPVADDIVKQKTGEIIDKKSGQGAKRLLDVGGMILGFIVYFFMAFPLNQMVGNMIRVGPPVSAPADTLMAGQDGGKYGVWEPVSEKFITGVIESISGAVISTFLLIFLGGPIYLLVLFYFALRLIGIEKKGCLAKDDKTDLKRACRFLCCFFPLICLMGIGIIILYFRMYFTADLTLPTLLFGMPTFSLPRLGFEIPNFPALSIGISLCFATLIRIIISCCKCQKMCFKMSVKMGCCKPECKLPVIGEMQEKQFGTVIVGYKVFRFHCSKIFCGIPFGRFGICLHLLCAAVVGDIVNGHSVALQHLFRKLVFGKLKMKFHGQKNT